MSDSVATRAVDTSSTKSALSRLRVAIVHYWYVRRRGGERVLEALADMFPQADLFFMFVESESLPESILTHKVRTSFLQKIPGVTRHYRKLLPLFPLALEQFRLDDYDLVISSESGPAKGVLTRSGICHICYCHTPMRYIWDMYHKYRDGGELSVFSRAAFALAAHYVRMWDFSTASRVDHFVANSQTTAARIRKLYGREAKVINPPVSVTAGRIATTTGDYYLVVSPLVGYKRVDLAIEACNRLQRPLRVVGDGEELRRLNRLAGPTVQILGYLSDDAVRENYAHCRALLFPGEEDFGLVPVEAQSFGRPVIAYGRGGALETVIGFDPTEETMPDGATGIFFREQTAESLADAMRAFESMESRFRPQSIRAHADRFDVSQFKLEMAGFLAAKMSEFRDSNCGASRQRGYSAKP